MDGIHRQVFIKLINNECVQSLLRDIGVLAKNKHSNGEFSTVATVVAGLGTNRVWVANLPPEVQDAVVKTALAPFGKATAIK
jgi:hypothetical protein